MMLLPKKIGPLTLQRKLGAGGVSETYLGVTEDDRRVAVRRILPFVRQDGRRLAQVEARVRDLLGIKHPFLVQALDWVEADNERFVVEQWVEGIDLERVIAWCRQHDQTVPHNVFLNVATQVCSALEVLHGRPGKGTGAENVLHLGLQPGHIFVTPDSKVQVGGYSLVRSPTALPQGGIAGPVPTRMEYLSPEQTHPDQKLLPASDVFALGCILYELLTLEPLFRADSNLQTIHRVRRAEVAGPLQKVKERMPGLDKVLFRALSLNPRHRYQRAFVLREDLRGLMAGYSFASIHEDTRAFLAPIEAETTSSLKRSPDAAPEAAPADPPAPDAAAPDNTAAHILIDQEAHAAVQHAEEIARDRQELLERENAAFDQTELTDSIIDPDDEWNELPTDLHVVDEQPAPAGPPAVIAQPRGAAPPLAPEHPLGAPMREPDHTAAFLSDGQGNVEDSRPADSHTLFDGAPPPPMAGDDEESTNTDFIRQEPPSNNPTLYPEDELGEPEASIEDELRADDVQQPAPPTFADDPMEGPTELETPTHDKVDVPLVSKPDDAFGGAPTPIAPAPYDAAVDSERATAIEEAPPAPAGFAPPPLSRPDPTAEVPIDEPARSSKLPIFLGVAAVLLLGCAGLGAVGFYVGSGLQTDLEGQLAELEAVERDILADAVADAEEGDDAEDALADAFDELAEEVEPDAGDGSEDEPEEDDPVVEDEPEVVAAAVPKSEPKASTGSTSYGSGSSSYEPKTYSSGSSTKSSGSTYSAPKKSTSSSASTKSYASDDDDLFAELALAEPDGLAELTDTGTGSDVSEATNLDEYVSGAKNGRLGESEVMMLELVEDNDPSYTRSRALLLMNAEQKGDSRAVKRYIDQLMVLPENQYNSVYLSKKATYYANSGSYQSALDVANEAERYWARIPPELVFSTKADIYATQAASWQGLFYKDGEDLDLLDNAIRGWEKYRRHALTKADTSMARKADTEIEKLEDIRSRLE